MRQDRDRLRRRHDGTGGRAAARRRRSETPAGRSTPTPDPLAPDGSAPVPRPVRLRAACRPGRRAASAAPSGRSRCAAWPATRAVIVPAGSAAAPSCAAGPAPTCTARSVPGAAPPAAGGRRAAGADGRVGTHPSWVTARARPARRAPCRSEHRDAVDDKRRLILDQALALVDERGLGARCPCGRSRNGSGSRRWRSTRTSAARTRCSTAWSTCSTWSWAPPRRDPADIDWRQRLRALGPGGPGAGARAPGRLPAAAQPAAAGASASWLTAALRGILHDAGVPADQVPRLARMICAFLLGLRDRRGHRRPAGRRATHAAAGWTATRRSSRPTWPISCAWWRSPFGSVTPFGDPGPAAYQWCIPYKGAMSGDDDGALREFVAGRCRICADRRS